MYRLTDKYELLLSQYIWHIGNIVGDIVVSHFISDHDIKSFIAKRVISIFVNFRYLRFKLLKYKENNKSMIFLS